MAKSEDSTKIKNKFTDKYRLVIYNDNNLEEVGFIRLSRLNLLAGTMLLLIIFVGIVYALIAFTPVKEFIPGYPDGSLRRGIIMNALKVDSLEDQLRIRDNYILTVNSIISGKSPADTTSGTDTIIRAKNLDFSRSLDDSLFREQMEQEEKYNLSLLDELNKPKSYTIYNFFVPVNGIITNSFNPAENHFGTDIVAGPNEVVKATMDGTVISADWTLETGYVIQIQHEDNIISIYKHNSQLLKTTGAFVKAGDPIAIIGNSGEFTTGPHLHFELWKDGKPLDPENYIVF